jgi:hypothetical protein
LAEDLERELVIHAGGVGQRQRQLYRSARAQHRQRELSAIAQAHADQGEQGQGCRRQGSYQQEGRQVQADDHHGEGCRHGQWKVTIAWPGDSKYLAASATGASIKVTK